MHIWRGVFRIKFSIFCEEMVIEGSGAILNL